MLLMRGINKFRKVPLGGQKRVRFNTPYLKEQVRLTSCCLSWVYICHDLKSTFPKLHLFIQTIFLLSLSCMLGFRSMTAPEMPPALVALLNVPGVVTGIWGDLDTGYLERFVQLNSSSMDRSAYSIKITYITVDWKEKVSTQPKMPKHPIPENISKWYSTLNCKLLIKSVGSSNIMVWFTLNTLTYMQHYNYNFILKQWL